MKVFKLPKKGGGHRTIHAPSKKEKAEYRKLIPPLTALCQKLDGELEALTGYPVLHGFMPGRSAVTNAMQHVGDWDYTLNFDLKDFFDSVGPQHFYGLSSEDTHLLGKTIGGNNCLPTYQGLPTSPVLANIAFVETDLKIISDMAAWFGGMKCFRYTRYADDITLSVRFGGVSNSDRSLIVKNFKSRVESLVASRAESLVALRGFTLNPKKTRVQWSCVGRREVTGVMVDQHGVYPTRRTKERLRAALHQQNAPQVQGLTEWCKLRTPGGVASIRKAVKSYRKAWDFAKRLPTSAVALRGLLIAENDLKVAAYLEGIDPNEAMRKAHEKV